MPYTRRPRSGVESLCGATRIRASICRPVASCRCQRDPDVRCRACDDRCVGHAGRPWHLCSASGRALELSVSSFRSYLPSFLSNVGLCHLHRKVSASTIHAKSMIIRRAREFGGGVLTLRIRWLRNASLWSKDR